ncbi:MAG: transcription termination/antitermination factor NusG [Lachnospiraceae bacterium]|nr:transcription termination/antitermination factor NusG [Lachnospiraceae bacterium]
MSEIVENEATISDVASEKVPSSSEARWYVAHTYSGYENKVKKDIEKTIENRKLHDQILEVAVPVQDVVEVKNGAKKTVSKKLFPGYVLVHMYMNDVTWYVVRNTRGVTGFVGPESKPVPLTEAEMRTLGINVKEVQIDVEVGDMIKVVTGAWEGNSGEIKAINESKQTVTIEVDIFGRATSVEIGFVDIQKI